jgi:hypothetical protein
MDRIRAAFRGGTSGGGGRDSTDGGDDSSYPPLATSLGPTRSAAGTAAAAPPPPPQFAPQRRPSLLAANSDAPSGRSSFATGVERFGIQSKGMAYFRDPFHSMVALPTARFYPMFFFVYLVVYVFFALLYLTFSDRCIKGMEGRFSHALWIASRTAGECVSIGGGSFLFFFLLVLLALARSVPALRLSRFCVCGFFSPLFPTTTHTPVFPPLVSNDNTTNPPNSPNSHPRLLRPLDAPPDLRPGKPPDHAPSHLVRPR